jgi:hypothetical protein
MLNFLKHAHTAEFTIKRQEMLQRRRLESFIAWTENLIKKSNALYHRTDIFYDYTASRIADGQYLQKC